MSDKTFNFDGTKLTVTTKNDGKLLTITYDVTSDSQNPNQQKPDPDFVYTLREALQDFSSKNNNFLINELINNNNNFYVDTYLRTPVYASIDQLPYSNKILQTMVLFGSMCGLYTYVDCDMYDYPELQNKIYSDYTYSSAVGSLIGIPMRRTAQYLALIPGIIFSPIILVGALIGQKNMT
jgi:hypothetical protein